MANLAAYAILGAIVTSGGIFLIRELRGRAGDAAEDVSNRVAYGDWPVVPSVSSFHGEGLNQ